VNVWYDTAKKIVNLVMNISGYTGPIFAIFPLYESTLGADDGSVLYFPTLLYCHGNQMLGETRK